MEFHTLSYGTFTKLLTLSGGDGLNTATFAGKVTSNNNGAISAEIQAKGTYADGYRAGFLATNTHTGGLTWGLASTNNSDGAFGGGKFVIGKLGTSEGLGELSTGLAALTIDSSLNATFGGNATLPSTGVLSIGSHTLKQVGNDLEIYSAGGDLDVPTWIRMRSSSGGTITGGWKNDASSKLHLGGDCTQTDYTLKIDATPLTSGSLYTAGNATFSGDVSTGNGGITWRIYTGTTNSTSAGKLVADLGSTLMATSCGMTFRIDSSNANPHAYGAGNASSVVGDADIWCSLHNGGYCYIYVGSGYYSQPYKVCIFFTDV